MHIVILVTAANKQEGECVAQELLKKKLVACVNIIDKISSFFWWEGKIDRGKEVLLVIKSNKEKLTRIIKCVKSAHSYEVPEIIALPIIGGNKDYLKWIDDSIR